MNQSEKRLFLIQSLLNERPSCQRRIIPADSERQKVLLRGLMNVRRPYPIGAEFLQVQDAYLQGETAAKGVTDTGERFEQHFSDFAQKYGIRDMYSGGFYPFPTQEEFWAYWSRYIYINRYQDAPKPVYNDLLKLVQDKDYFVITTNVDHCFQKAGFDKKRLFYTPGDYGLFQCSEPCCQETFENEAVIREMVTRQENRKIPTGLLPVCPHCGKPMTMNLRSDNKFVEDEGWHKAAERYENFLCTRNGQKILFLELGVGYNTPVFCSSSTRDNSKNIRLKQQISGFPSKKQKDLKKGGVRNVWQTNVKNRKHAGLYQQSA